MGKPIETISGHGSHYSINKATEPMELLKSIFPDATANEMNFCLFSTSGVHGSYWTIEQEEQEAGIGITFLIIHPRLVTMTYGVVEPKTPEGFIFLKKLRVSSKQVVMEDIG